MTSFGRVNSVDQLDAILALDSICFHRPWTRADYERELQDPGRCFLFLVRVEGEVVGYCSFWRIFDEIHLNNFAIHPSRRRQGLGGALLAHVLGEATALGAPNATLEVRASNAAAIAMYERGGFARAGRRRAYYTHPVEDAIILWRGRPGPP
ncbi:MAG: ribosomal protein S18-alanine N-acetyltransferase [Acidobacteria bacterium]|nr:ribosomal protein S18-alanine N-acetyltransferase [Acidobacteriota bacterium]